MMKNCCFYIVHMSEKNQIFLTNYILNSTLMKWVKMNGMRSRVQVLQTGHLDSCGYPANPTTFHMRRSICDGLTGLCMLRKLLS